MGLRPEALNRMLRRHVTVMTMQPGAASMSGELVELTDGWLVIEARHNRWTTCVRIDHVVAVAASD